MNGVGPITLRNLITAFGGPEEVFKAPYSKLIKVKGVGPATVRSILDFDAHDRVKEEIDFMTDRNVRMHALGTHGYPRRLKQIPDAPLVLFSRGDMDLDAERMIAVVGTRRCTPYGTNWLRKALDEWAQSSVTVVSGMAYGVDIHAHRNCVALGVPTVGVVAHGLDRIYPASHRNVMYNMFEQGGVVSELWSGSGPERENFPKRNRIIAGLVDAVVVIETHATGGAMITARLANDYNREVMALPGDVGRSASAGCNQLIRSFGAHLIDSPNDLIELMQWDRKSRPKQGRLFPELNGDEQQVMDLLGGDAVHIDELLIRSGMSSSRLAINLLALELKDCISVLPGKRYKRL